ncbi:DNA-binding protein [Rhizobiaceae bacterium n13]|uniref:DNA-binding protein n=1 Tax=Ferirhizobium litorale TaxID=2927786 RepID=A0AAE3QD38_9HYPH|nr:DNA-binding protein [Fererhizobium litorale]MDI7921156.1 DNA-binding protein [Fererhizobium litorale]
MTGMTIGELSEQSGLPASVIFDLETNTHAVEDTVLQALKRTLEDRGIVFLTNGSQEPGGPGIRLKVREDEEGIRPEHLNATNDD